MIEEQMPPQEEENATEGVGSEAEEAEQQDTIESGFDSDESEENEEKPEEDDQEEEPPALSLVQLQEEKDKAEKKARTAIEQKKRWREKAKASEAMADANVVEFRFDHPELKTSHVKEVQEYARANKLSLEDAYNKPLVQQYFKSIQKSDEILNAIPNTQHTKSTKKQIDWASASLDDVRKHRQNILRQNRQ